MTPTEFVPSGNVRLALYRWPETPEPNRPVIVLMHGYPDNAGIWTPLAERLAEDFTVVAYDMRGAGLSSAPKHRSDYALTWLVADLNAVIDAVSPERPVHLVAYDWGALQAWDALASPAMGGRIASLSTAAPSLDQVGNWFRQRLTSGSPSKLLGALSQLAGSSYMLAFQLPLLPEIVWHTLLGKHWPRLVKQLEGVAPPHPRQSADGRHGLGLYRANLMQRLLRPQPTRTDVPVQLLQFQRDRFVPERLYEGLDSWVRNLRRTPIDAGHWAVFSHASLVAGAVGPFVSSIEEF